DMLLDFKKEGMTSIIISHKLNEIAYCADNITVIRDGGTVETIDNSSHTVDEERIIKGMVGRELTDRYPVRVRKTDGDVVFEVKDWNVYHPIYDEKKVVNNVSFKVRRGEVVGFSGLQGAGRTELMMSLFGKSYGRNIFGEEYINGVKVKLKNTRDAINHGLAYVTEDRKNNGLILSDTISWNTVMAKVKKVADKFGIVDNTKQDEAAEYYVRRLRTRTPSIYQNTGNLSGGNQQKVLLGKWMFTEPEIFILDEPTRGIDVGAKYEIYTIINEMVRDGKSVVMVSSDLSELLGMCDRIYVMNAGTVVAEFDVKDATQEKIMTAILNSDNK
ncbi:MAG: sugar ABC transporter ATP-binding protein, partial [Lachnospiraceae bacterium]|nr:sugar ABC transporter ATP-binding protein [Lachnospiraceae bacterium]